MRRIVSDDKIFNCQQWLHEDRLHREGGPAVVFADGGAEWWKYGKRHRTDGPAVIWPSNIHGWYIEGERITRRERYQELTKLSSEEMMLLELKYGNVR